MNSVEDQVRSALNGLADEAQSAPLLQRLERKTARSWSTSPAAVLARGGGGSGGSPRRSLTDRGAGGSGQHRRAHS